MFARNKSAALIDEISHSNNTFYRCSGAVGTEKQALLPVIVNNESNISDSEVELREHSWQFVPGETG